MTKWKYEFDLKKEPELLTTQQLLSYTLTHCDRDGSVERLEERIDKLTEALICVVGMLSESKQIEVVQTVAYGWEVHDENK